MTREPGPTSRAGRWSRPAGSTLLGPRVAPALTFTVSSASTRSWNRWVWTTRPGVDRRAVAELDEVGLGQPVGVAPHAVADLGAEHPQPHVERPGARGRCGRTSGAARNSVKVSASSLRQTKPDQSGCSPTVMPADEQPLGGDREQGGDDPGDRQDHAAEDRGSQTARREEESSAKATATLSTTAISIGMTRIVSTTPRAP